jgi:outer membrane lipoprotein-sorting protein
MNVTTLDVTDKNITVAKGIASAAAADGAGLFVDVSGTSMRYTFSSNTWEYNVGLTPSANNSWDLGLTGLRWKTVFANTITAVNISGNGSALTSVSADTVGGNTASTLRTYSDTVAATAYSNAAADSSTKAATAYSNAVSYADTKAATAYSNAVSYADTKAATAYSNAVNVLAPKASPTFTGTISLGSNVSINTSAVFVGNSIANSYINSNGLYVNGQIFQSGGGYYKGNKGAIGNTDNKGNLFRINANNQSNNITISTGENAIAVGPITVELGYAFTVETGGRAVII